VIEEYPRPTLQQNALAPCLLVFVLTLLLIPSAKASSPNDFAFYWTAARLTLDGANPYSPADTEALQQRLSFQGKGRLVMLNPPWTLPLIAPFGLLPYSTASSLWFLLQLSLLLISIQWLWQLYGRVMSPWIGWLVSVTFLPLAVVLAIGQIGPLMLFGIAGFLRFETRRHDYLAGALLFLAAVKPHLIYLLWIALFLDAVRHRRWKPFASFAGVLTCASLVAIFLDYRVFQQYLELVAGGGLVSAEMPTLGGLMRHISGLALLQFLPIAVAAGWFAIYWIRQRAGWNWQEQLPELLLASVVSTSYSWFFDQVVLLPSLICATGLALRLRPARLAAAVAGYALVNCVVLLLILTHRTTFWYSWTAFAWLALYAFVRVGVPTSSPVHEPVNVPPRS